MKIYTLSSCDTCRKALKLLRAAGHDLQVVDVRADGIAPADLAALAAAFGPRLVNRASALVGLGLETGEVRVFGQVELRVSLMNGLGE